MVMTLIIALMWLLFVVIAVEAITEIIVSGDIFAEMRGWFSRQENWILNFISRLITCGYCCSVWVAALLAWYVPIHSQFLIIDIIIKTALVHRVANWFHEYMSRWLGRHPWTCVVHKVGKR